MGDESLDLFGDPLLPLKETRGRPSHRRIVEIAEKVAKLAATGATHEAIARRVGLSDKTLRKYYSRELEDGGTLVRNLLDEAMIDKALKGDVAAYRAVKAEIKTGEARAAASAPAPRPGRREAMAPRLGKKEQAQVDAHSVGGMLAPGAPPARLN